LRPASRACSRDHSWAVPFACAALPPLLAISRRLSWFIPAKRLGSLATVSSRHPCFRAVCAEREHSGEGSPGRRRTQTGYRPTLRTAFLTTIVAVRHRHTSDFSGRSVRPRSPQASERR
jgi:hypothetical protein